SLHDALPISNNKGLNQLLEAEAIEADPELLVIQREIYQNGRSVCRVNGSIVTISRLKEIGSYLIDIHGQNEHQELMQHENHIHLLDHFGKEKIKSLLDDYENTYNEYRTVLKRYNDWQDKEQERSEERRVG